MNFHFRIEYLFNKKIKILVKNEYEKKIKLLQNQTLQRLGLPLPKKQAKKWTLAMLNYTGKVLKAQYSKMRIFGKSGAIV